MAFRVTLPIMSDEGRCSSKYIWEVASECSASWGKGIFKVSNDSDLSETPQCVVLRVFGLCDPRVGNAKGPWHLMEPHWDSVRVGGGVPYLVEPYMVLDMSELAGHRSCDQSCCQSWRWKWSMKPPWNIGRRAVICCMLDEDPSIRGVSCIRSFETFLDSPCSS